MSVCPAFNWTEFGRVSQVVISRWGNQCHVYNNLVRLVGFMFQGTSHRVVWRPLCSITEQQECSSVVCPTCSLCTSVKVLRVPPRMSELRGNYKSFSSHLQKVIFHFISFDLLWLWSQELNHYTSQEHHGVKIRKEVLDVRKKQRKKNPCSPAGTENPIPVVPSAWF